MDACPGPDGDPPSAASESVGATVWRLLKRHGWSWQAPARRALERDEHAVELWKKEVWPGVKTRPPSHQRAVGDAPRWHLHEPRTPRLA
ncbi:MULTISPECIES: winged helix-turn-helix domain-containing protein [unclassified Streptomyces]|uniref:helix-turn-helix domain-containing protein n=1 Tax=unclassified Streptomyces TaxID=2593676 RepID=UPI0038642F2A